jgi:hypothetical protein
VLLTLFLLYTTATVLIGVFAEETVTMDTLSAALCVYLLMGFIWGGLYGRSSGTLRQAATEDSAFSADVPRRWPGRWDLELRGPSGEGGALRVAAEAARRALDEEAERLAIFHTSPPAERETRSRLASKVLLAVTEK